MKSMAFLWTCIRSEKKLSSQSHQPGVLWGGGGGGIGDGMHSYDVHKVFYLNCEFQVTVVRDSGPWVEQILQQSENV